MSEQQIDTVMQRLECLEQEVRQCKREQRWWRLVGSGVVAALVAVLLAGATGSKVAEEIRARKFVVIDREGKIRAAWGHGVSDWGPSQEDLSYTGLVFYGEEADSRVSLGISEWKSGIYKQVDQALSFRQNKGYVGLGVNSAFTIFGLLVNPQLSLSNILDDNTAIGVTVSSSLPSRMSSGGTYLSFYKRPFFLPKASTQELLGASRVSLEMDGDGSSRLKLRDKDGQKYAVLGSIDLTEPGTGIVTKRPPSSLVLFDEDGRAIWKAP